MANCDDLKDLRISHVEDISENDLCCHRNITLDDVDKVAADQTEFENVHASVTKLRGTDVDESMSIVKETDADDRKNEQQIVVIEKEESPAGEDFSPLGESSTSTEPIPLSPPYIDDADSDVVCEQDDSTLNTESNVQISDRSPSVYDTDLPACDGPLAKSSRDPVRKQGIQPLNRADCRVIFSSKDNSCVIENTSISAVANKSPPTNNNVAQTVNKENEFVVESTGSEDYPVDTLLPLIKSPNVLVSKKKRSSVSLANRGRRVSFPEDTRIITSYLEPVNPWVEMADVNHEDIIRAYRTSCERHATSPVQAVLQQISALPLVFGGRVQCLNLRNQKLDSNQCESLEEVFRRVQFKMLNFESCGLDDDSVIPLFDMIEFYDSCTQLNISCNTTICSRGWQMCAKMLKKSQSIELLDAHSTNLCEQTVPILARVLRLDTKLQTLHLENCNLTERPLAALAGALRVNETLRELYLADNHIGPKDCIHLENLIAFNTVLKTLDLRNNNIQDEGCQNLCQGIHTQQMNISQSNTDSNKEQRKWPAGLRNLVLWNNHLTYGSVTSISMLISTNSLQTLNLGKNNITSEGLISFQSNLLKNKNITNLGLQATRIEDEGVIALAECLAGNTSLQRIDLRENNIRVAGLSALASVLSNVNKTLVTIDLDANNRLLNGEEERLYNSMRTAIGESCRKNHTNSHVNKDVTAAPNSSDASWLRKASLTCETIAPPDSIPIESKRYFSPEPSPCPSPSPSPIPSPVNSRFRVCKAPDSFMSISVSKTPLVLSTSAPAALTIPSEVGSGTATLSSAGTVVKNRFSGYRFTVTKVSDGSSLLGGSQSKTMSTPSLNMPDNYYSSEAVVVVPSIKVKTVSPFLPQHDSSPSDDVFLDADSIPARSNLMKAPLAAMEGESFDTDSEESEAKMDKSETSETIKVSVST